MHLHFWEDRAEEDTEKERAWAYPKAVSESGDQGIFRHGTLRGKVAQAAQSWFASHSGI